MDQMQQDATNTNREAFKYSTYMHYFILWFIVVCCLSNDDFFLLFFFFFYSQSRRIYCYYDRRYLALEEKELTQHKREELLAASITMFCPFIYFSSWSDAESYLSQDQNKNGLHALIIQYFVSLNVITRIIDILF